MRSDRRWFQAFALLLVFGVGSLPPSVRADENTTDERVARRVPNAGGRVPNHEPVNLEVDNDEQARLLKARSVTIMNYTAKPFSYQISRSSGAPWTHEYTLASKMKHTFTATEARNPYFSRSLLSLGKPGHVFIRFRVTNGWEEFKVLTNSSYAYVENENGYGELVDPTVTHPMARIKAGEEQKFLSLLQANHCFEIDPNHP
jgi:hypothetical protein